MAISKFFGNLNISTLGKKKNRDFSEFLESNICEYSLSVVWTNGVATNLNYLSENRPP